MLLQFVFITVEYDCSNHQLHMTCVLQDAVQTIKLLEKRQNNKNIRLTKYYWQHNIQQGQVKLTLKFKQ